MRRKIIITILILISTLTFSQDYMDEIALKACGCMNAVSDTLETEKFDLELGHCIINSCIPYEKELKNDFNIELKLESCVAELGWIVASRMETVCPDTFIIIVDKIKNNEQQVLNPAIAPNDLVFADKFYRENNYAIALAYYEECSKIDSTIGIVNYRLGVCYSRLFRFQISTEYFKKSIKLEYRKGDALFNIALNFHIQLDDRLALKYFELALKELPDDEYIQLRIIELKALRKL